MNRHFSIQLVTIRDAAYVDGMFARISGKQSSESATPKSRLPSVFRYSLPLSVKPSFRVKQLRIVLSCRVGECPCCHVVGPIDVGIGDSLSIVGCLSYCCQHSLGEQRDTSQLLFDLLGKAVTTNSHIWYEYLIRAKMERTRGNSLEMAVENPKVYYGL